MSQRRVCPLKDIPIFIISLASDVARRRNIRQKMERLGLSFEFFDAAEGRSRLEEVGLRVDDGYIMKRRGYPLTDGEVGCYLSHYFLWTQCAERNTPMVVLEDDAVLLPGFREIYQDLSEQKFDYIKLEKRSSGKPINGTLMLLDRNKSGTVGYFIRPKAAEKFIKATQSIRLPVDNFIGAIWWHGVGPVGVSDAVVEHSEDWSSNIQTNRIAAEARREYTLPVRIQRKLHRLKYSMNYKIFLLKNRKSIIN